VFPAGAANLSDNLSTVGDVCVEAEEVETVAKREDVGLFVERQSAGCEVLFGGAFRFEFGF